jgi:hypothetical protein
MLYIQLHVTKRLTTLPLKLSEVSGIPNCSGNTLLTLEGFRPLIIRKFLTVGITH